MKNRTSLLTSTESNFQLKGWQVKKQAIGFRPRIPALPSVASAPNECWSTDLRQIGVGSDNSTTLILVIDCPTRELLGGCLCRVDKVTTASRVLGHALIARLGTPRQWAAFTSCSYDLRYKFSTPHCAQQNGMVERVIRMPKEYDALIGIGSKPWSMPVAGLTTAYPFITTGLDTRRRPCNPPAEAFALAA